MNENLATIAGLLFDPLFATPFFTGLAFAVVLPVLGTYLRLRDEWLAALAFAQTAAAGALLAMLAGLAPLFGGLLAATGVAGLKSSCERRTPATQGAAYALLLVAGWGVSVLLVANLPLAERLGHALFDGQLYFVDRQHLIAAWLTLMVAGVSLRRLSRTLLLCHLFPDFFRARGRSEGRVHLVFDMLVAAVLATATMSVGVMAAFALIFVPPLLAWRWANNWHRALVWATCAGLAGYLLAFVLALAADQPFGPVLALLFVALAVLSGLASRSRGVSRV